MRLDEPLDRIVDHPPAAECPSNADEHRRREERELRSDAKHLWRMPGQDEDRRSGERCHRLRPPADRGCEAGDPDQQRCPHDGRFGTDQKHIETDTPRHEHERPPARQGQCMHQPEQRGGEQADVQPRDREDVDRAGDQIRPRGFGREGFAAAEEQGRSEPGAGGRDVGLERRDTGGTEPVEEGGERAGGRPDGRDAIAILAPHHRKAPHQPGPLPEVELPGVERRWRNQAPADDPYAAADQDPGRFPIDRDERPAGCGPPDEAIADRMHLDDRFARGRAADAAQRISLHRVEPPGSRDHRRLDRDRARRLREAPGQVVGGEEAMPRNSPARRQSQHRDQQDDDAGGPFTACQARAPGPESHGGQGPPPADDPDRGAAVWVVSPNARHQRPGDGAGDHRQGNGDQRPLRQGFRSQSTADPDQAGSASPLDRTGQIGQPFDAADGDVADPINSPMKGFSHDTLLIRERAWPVRGANIFFADPRSPRNPGSCDCETALGRAIFAAMKALLLTEYETLSYEDVADPVCGPDDVLIQVRACGICGSDIHGYDGSTGRRIPPLVMGHEAAGVIASVGANVRGFAAGDRVTFDSTVFCGDCLHCRRGDVNLCDDRQVLGVSCGAYRRHGAFAEFVAVPARILHALPAGLGFNEAAMIEAVSVGVHAVRLTPVTPGDTAVVVGTGMIGLLTLQAARIAGFAQVIAVDTEDSRLAVARELGATRSFNPNTDGDLTDFVKSLTNGQGADAAFECVGLNGTVLSAIHAVRKGGTVTLVGNLSPMTELPLQIVVTRQLRLQGSCASAGEIPRCIELLASGQIKVGRIISAVVPLEQGGEWFARLHAGLPGVMKVILSPHS